MSAAICTLAHCRGVLDIRVLRGGRVETSCPQCDRRRAGICRDCPQPVYGTVGKAIRCASCARRARLKAGKRHRDDPEVRRRVAARDRRRYRTSEEYRERKRRNRRAWATRNREKIRRAKRRFLMKEGPSREKYLATQRRHNADPVRAEKKRQHAVARYYELHPIRPDPHCAGCKGRLAWSGAGAPPRWCDDCCSPAEKSRRRKLGRSITVVREAVA